MAIQLGDKVTGGFQQFINILITKTPLFTVSVALVTFVCGVLNVFLPVTSFFGLSLKNITQFRLHTLNTYPLVHHGFLTFVFGLIGIFFLMPRFEKRYGTICTIAMFFGFLEVIPGIAFLFACYVSDSNTVFVGISGWTFSLLTMYLMNLFYDLHPKILALPQLVRMVLAIAAPFLILPFDFSESIILHLTAVVLSIIFSLAYMDFLLPPARFLVWIETKLSRVVDAIPNYISVTEASYYQGDALPVQDLGSNSAGIV
ncbi:rhomboid family protease [Schizosaccharomyces cryophilus OY26]|uniref:Rhomboid family protease n=1 Tax=Schizosaccharomyces cryophilus (strain OY26 / ATCC MYA-4695 / CBS 11777 / NBRC 106824 / NRRL Y48691) TaxID=653667 RepID=S9W272_SCHCR|nr:rhomboid family protease [Schizosaccharomyces cryophilus OY26]EPY52459.1 rhomboid family protease [Schizosaccharomyces cryophilus OY26]